MPRTSPPPSGSGGRNNGGGGGSEHGLVMHLVLREGGGGTTLYPVLGKNNYNNWSLLMKIKLQARGLWGAIEPGEADVPEQEDRMALDAICSAVPEEMLSTIAVKPSVKLAWEAIHTMRIGDDRVRKSSAQRVRREYELLAFREGESVEDFALRLTGIVNQLATLGDVGSHF